MTRDSHPRETDDQYATSVGQEICVEQAIAGDTFPNLLFFRINLATYKR